MDVCTTNPFGITLTESKDVLRLGTDCLLLSAYIKSQTKDTALEIGAGSGVISLLLAKRGCFKKIHAVEIQNDIFSLLRANVKENGFEQIIEPANADIRFCNPEDFKGVSVIFSNPPYMRADSGKASPVSQKQASRHEIFGGAADFCKAAAKILKTGGRLYLVYRPDRLATLMRSLSDSGFSPKRMTFVHATEEHAPSTVICEAVLGGGEQLNVTRPLILSRDGKPTEDCDHIYKNAVFPSDFYKP